MVMGEEVAGRLSTLLDCCLDSELAINVVLAGKFEDLMRHPGNGGLFDRDFDNS
jgi:hypothetical protein